MNRFSLFRSSRFGLPWCALGVLAIVAMVGVPAASALTMTCSTVPPSALLPTGTFVTPGDCTGTPSGTLLATLSAPFVSTTGVDSGTLISAVFREAGGTLDFYYQVVLNTTSTNCGTAGKPPCDPLGRETDSSFTGFTTWVATREDGGSLPGGVFVNGTPVLPITADRTALGDTVGFSFTPPNSAEIQPGQTSAVLVIATDATNFRAGFASVIDGGTTTVASFQPTTGVPEPASLGLLGCGLLLLAGVRRFKTRRGV